jgi:hypothetical protein
MTIQFNRGLLLAKEETTFNTAVALSAALDAFEVINPDFTPDITSQRREVVANDISPFEALVTRKVGRMTFSLEVKSNGNTTATVAPRIGRLLKACGFTEQQINTAAECVFRTVPGTSNVGDLNFYGSSATFTGGVYLKIKCTITQGGGSGVAVASFEAPAEATAATGGLAELSMTDTDNVILTNGVQRTLHDNAGNPIVSITPDFQSNNPVTGDVYWIHVRPIGYLYQPTTDNISSLTIDIQYPDDSGQSIRHRLTGARGTVSVNAQVGQFPTFDFEFTGTYNPQVDEATLTGTFEDQDPTQVQYAALALAQRYGPKETGLCASSWGIDMANEIAIRDCINELNASEGAFLTARSPTVTYDPEAVLAAVEPIWSYLENGTSVEWWVRHGTVDGNIVLFHAPNQQITNIGYADRNAIRVFNIDGSLARLNGNDELQILFT